MVLQTCNARGGAVFWKDPENGRAYLVGIMPKENMFKTTRGNLYLPCSADELKGLESENSYKSGLNELGKTLYFHNVMSQRTQKWIMKTGKNHLKKMKKCLKNSS